MDLCLKGSQINLASRQKPKPKYTSQLNLSSCGHLRPSSAGYSQKGCSSPSFLCRPRSADAKFVRNFGNNCRHYCSENDLQGSKSSRYNSKQFDSLSSSNILKLLLNEPIKRVSASRIDLCSVEGSSPDPSELSASRRTTITTTTTSQFWQNKQKRSESIAGNSSADGDNSARFCRPSIQTTIRNRKATISATTTKISNASNSKTTRPATATDHWHSAASVHSNQTPMSTSMSSAFVLAAKGGQKPDLPGRVSFGKPPHTVTNDIDSSDCDNDKQDPYTSSYNSNDNCKSLKDEDISAPGPLHIPELLSFTNGNHNPTAAVSPVGGLKKSVHFGAAGPGGAVVAETYEYPKCPSENCSCSTRSSSTASVHDPVDTKCACDSPTCKYAFDGNRGSSSTGGSSSKSSTHLLDLVEIVDENESTALEATSKAGSNKTSATHEPTLTANTGCGRDDSTVIRDYQSTVGHKLENSLVKNILTDEKTPSYTTSLNNAEMPNYLAKFTLPAKKANTLLEKQNNLSESSHSAMFKSQEAKHNLLASATGELIKTENNFDNNLAEKSSYPSSSDTVINNYLKVVTSVPIANKKKDNNNKRASGLLLHKNHKSLSANPKSTAAKIAKVSGSSADGGSHLKKAISFSSLREDTNLNEFNLDKVDSWMSRHESTMLTRKAQYASMDGDYEKLTKETLRVIMNAEDDEPGDSASQLSMKSEENSQEDSTYDELVSVIKEIDDDKTKDTYPGERNNSNEMELKINTPLPSPPETIQGRNDFQPNKSPDKYKDILSYLDNVEDSCDKTLLETRRSMPDSNRSEIEFIVEPDIVEDVPKLSDLLMLPNHQLARRVVALSLRANELSNALCLSKENLLKVRAEKQKAVRAEKSNTSTRLRDQKNHFEAIIRRHQGFIEQLLKDKGSLCEKVATFTRRLESQNQAWEHKLETELTRTKETTLAGEKIRRERWVRENTKKIKELTVKGLEVEIDKMNGDHQREVLELKRLHQQQLLDALEEARLKHEQIETNIRETCTQDRELIIEKERTAIRERFERQLDEERKSQQDQLHKVCEDLTAERERFQSELKAKELEYQNRRQEIQREKESDLGHAISDLQEKMSKQEEKYQNRINTIEKQYEADFEIWKREYQNTCKIAQVEQENNIRQHYRAERDRQIDAIVCRMDAESLKNADEYENKLSRLKDKYNKDLVEIENVEKSLREKYTDIRSKLAESDAEVRNCHAEVKQLQIELEHSKKMCDEFMHERDQLRENVRNELQAEVTTMKAERDNEIQKIHKRVQQAIEKKDATIDILQKENGGLRERCLKLEAVIRQQRKDYCVK